jgi:hypothetical protein
MTSWASFRRLFGYEIRQLLRRPGYWFWVLLATLPLYPWWLDSSLLERKGVDGPWWMHTFASSVAPLLAFLTVAVLGVVQTWSQASEALVSRPVSRRQIVIAKASAVAVLPVVLVAAGLLMAFVRGESFDGTVDLHRYEDIDNARVRGYRLSFEEPEFAACSETWSANRAIGPDLCREDGTMLRLEPGPHYFMDELETKCLRNLADEKLAGCKSLIGMTTRTETWGSGKTLTRTEPSIRGEFTGSRFARLGCDESFSAHAGPDCQTAVSNIIAATEQEKHVTFIYRSPSEQECQRAWREQFEAMPMHCANFEHVWSSESDRSRALVSVVPPVTLFWSLISAGWLLFWSLLGVATGPSSNGLLSRWLGLVLVLAYFFVLVPLLPGFSDPEHANCWVALGNIALSCLAAIGLAFWRWQRSDLGGVG